MKPLFSLFFALLVTACDREVQLQIGWTGVEPSAEISQLIADQLDSSERYAVVGKQFADTNELTTALANHEVDLAILEQPSSPDGDFTALISLYPSVLHVLAKPGMASKVDAGAYLTDVIRGKALYAGPPGSAGHTFVLQLVAYGVLPNKADFQLLDSPFDDDPDVYVVFGGILSADAVKRLKGFELVGLGNVEELGMGSWVEGIALRFPNLEPAIIPKGLYQEIGHKPTLSLAVQSLLVASSDLSEDVAYDITQRVSQNMAEIRAIYPLAGAQNVLQGDNDAVNLATHPGAVRYFERDAPGYLERYAETLAFLLTAVVALTSLAVGLVRMRRQAKKDRIDVYLDKILELRTALHDRNVAAQDIGQSVRELQSTVASLVVEERIAADSSFVGFLSLSNQLLKEVEDRL